jgi:hypothetical protein
VPINKLLAIAAALVAAVATAIAAVGLLHELISASDPHGLMHGLEAWVGGAGYHLALILLAATAVSYLAGKR